jgi:hypothetical protein
MSDYDLSQLPEHGEAGGSYNAQYFTVGQARLGVSIAPAPDQRSDFEAAQWTAVAPGMFKPSGRSFPHLPAGFYGAVSDQNGVYAVEQPLVADRLQILPGSCNQAVVDGIRRFWRSRPLYQQHGLSYKRGVLFYGAPGSGKTATILLLCKELIGEHGGAVFVCTDPNVLTMLLKKLRKIEAERPLIVVMEDLEEIIRHHGEHPILALLDGEEQIDNVVFLASSNYPEQLGARIVNRPSRFDERIFVDMPSEVTRKAYLQSVTANDPLSERDLKRWTADTKGMSIAHLRELVVAVQCLGGSYDDVLNRLKTMATRPKAKEGLGAAIGLSA